MARWRHSRALGLLLLALAGTSTARAQTAPHIDEPAPGPVASPEARSPIDELRAEVSALRAEVAELRAAGPPEWAGQLDRRIERTTVLLERLASRVETPVPRLDEPLTLLTVSACTLVLGFIAGRSARRRSERREARFRL